MISKTLYAFRITIVAKIITRSFFSVQISIRDYSYSRSDGMELISDTVTVVVDALNLLPIIVTVAVAERKDRK